MMDIINVPFKYGVAMTAGFIIIITCVAIYLANNYFNHRDFLKSLHAQEIKGPIILLRDQGRGSYSFTIQRDEKKFEMSLPISRQVKEFGIQVGDSMYKGTNNYQFIFYEAVDGQFRERCRVEIHP